MKLTEIQQKMLTHCKNEVRKYLRQKNFYSGDFIIQDAISAFGKPIKKVERKTKNGLVTSLTFVKELEVNYIVAYNGKLKIGSRAIMNKYEPISISEFTNGLNNV